MSTDDTKSEATSGGALVKLNGWETFAISMLALVGGGMLLKTGALSEHGFLIGLGVLFMGVYPIAALVTALMKLKSGIASDLTSAKESNLTTTLEAVAAVKSESRASLQTHTALVTAALAVMNEHVANTGKTVAESVNKVSTDTTAALVSKLAELPKQTAQELMVAPDPSAKPKKGAKGT